jgi:hypothetical protein
MRRWRSTLPLAALLTVATPLLAGPPWITIEYPVNPYDQSNRGAFLLVHAYHYGQAATMPVSGTAEGLVAGERRSVTLSFDRTSRAGVFGLRNQWGQAGEWSLVLTVSQGDDHGSRSDDVAQALVKVSGNRVIAVDVATRPGPAGTELSVVPRRFTPAEIEASLRDRAGR